MMLPALMIMMTMMPRNRLIQCLCSFGMIIFSFSAGCIRPASAGDPAENAVYYTTQEAI